MRAFKREELNRYKELLKTIKRQEVAGKSKFLTVENYECYLQNGKTMYREKLLKDHRDIEAAVVLPLTDEGTVILSVGSRNFIDETVGVELPAGYIEPGEKPEEAALRELLEETGYRPRKIEMIRKYHQDAAIMKGYNYIFLATGCHLVSRQQLDHDEAVYPFECMYEEVLELLDRGEINDGNSIIALESFKTLRKDR